MPADLRDQLDRDTPRRVAKPLARAVADAWTGPHARILAAATRPVSGPPGITVGGTATVSGGATATLLANANEYGSRRRQFRSTRPRTMAKAVEQHTPRILDALADICAAVVERVTR